MKKSERSCRMKCLCSGEQMRLIEEQDSKRRPDLGVSSALSAADNVDIDQVELSLRETSSLNYEVRFFLHHL